MQIKAIGFDGMSPNVLYPNLEHLPNFSRLVNEGVWGDLLSVNPPITGPAWATLMTGKGPEQTKIEGFSHQGQLLSYNDVLRHGTIFKCLNDAGHSAGVANCPVTYPPEKLTKGYFISGSWGPPRPDFFWPEGLPGMDAWPYAAVCSDVDPGGSKDLDFLERLEVDIASKMVKLPTVNFAFWGFISTDRVGHHYWDSPDKMLRIYKHCDALLGTLLTWEEDYIIIFSDHGFNSLYSKECATYMASWHGPHATRANLTGGHQRAGIFLMGGKNVRKNFEIRNAKLADVPATVLDLFGVPYVGQGNVLYDAFQVYTEKEEKELKTRLQGLGYVNE